MAVDGKYVASVVVFSVSEMKVIGRKRVWPQECWSVGSDLGRAGTLAK